MKKQLSVILISILMLAILIGCGNKKENEVKAKAEQGKIKVKALKGPPAVSMVKLFADNETGKTSNKYETSIINSVDEVVATVAKKDYDIITIPSNLASVMYNKTNGDVKIASILALGINYIVGNNDTVKSIQDLKGKTIYTFGKGATPEIVLNYVLKGNGLEPGKDVKIEFKSEATEVAAVLASEKDAIAMLPEPFLSSAQVKNPKLKVLISMGDEWDKVKGTLPKSQISGVVIVRKEFAEKLENDKNVLLFTKLKKGGFVIDTPYGNYSPDWAIIYKNSSENNENNVGIYFIVETKADKKEKDLTDVEKSKIKCGKLHFEAISKEVKFNWVNNYDDFKRKFEII